LVEVHRLRSVFAVALAFAAPLWAAEQARALACTSTFLAPSFGLDLVASGGQTFSDCSGAGFAQSVSGAGGHGSGSAFGITGLGSLGGKATAFNTLGGDGDAQGMAFATFSDTFQINVANLTWSQLQFTLSLTGSSVESGSGIATANAELGVNTFFVSLSSPGTAIVTVPLGGVGLFDVNVGGLLTVSAYVDSPLPGSAVADYSTTFKILSVQALDADGGFIQNVDLVDASGNHLLVGGAVPEPGALLLVAAALGALGAARRR